MAAVQKTAYERKASEKVKHMARIALIFYTSLLLTANQVGYAIDTSILFNRVFLVMARVWQDNERQVGLHLPV